MGTHNQNGGRHAPTDDNRASWRPQDQDASSASRPRGNEDDRDYGSWRERNQDHAVSDHDPRRWEGSRGSELGTADEGWSPERHGQRPSGYSAGRYGDDRTQHMAYRDDRMHGSDSRGFEPARRPWSAYDGPQRTPMERNDMRGQRPSEPSWGNQMGNQIGHHTGGAPQPRGAGPHRGKGPVGYQRSDERIRELVCEALADDEHIDASQINVAVKDGEVTLTGVVDDRRTRRDAEDCVINVSGVRDVLVQLRVKDDRQTKLGAADKAPPTYEPAADKKPRA